jgi:hypothetical protein
MKGLVVFASVIACCGFMEGVSFAKSPTPRSCARGGASTSTPASSLEPASFPMAGATRELNRSATREDADAMLRPTDAPTTAARVRICHISHHPLDGVRTPDRTCPLYFAGAGTIDSSSSPVITTPVVAPITPVLARPAIG